MLSWQIAIIILVLLFITNSVHKKSKGRFSRHHAVNDIIARALNLANFPAMLEPSGIVREDNKWPDGMTNVAWSHGRHLVWDFTCPDTLAPSHLRSTATEAGSAAKEAEERKVSKYRSIAAYHTFIPVAVETLGPMGPEAKSFLLDLGRRLRQHTGEPRSTSYLIYTADLNGDPEGQCCCHDGVTATREGTGQTATIVILHAIVLSIVL